MSTSSRSLPVFQILTAADVLGLIEKDREATVATVSVAYRTHAVGDSANPHSGFLRFPSNPDARIISLPDYLGGQFEVAGIKWIASFPWNTARGMSRASAVLILNDVQTGYPLVCMESSIVSATRTAATAVLALRRR